MRSIMRSLAAVVFVLGATYGVAAKAQTAATGGETVNVGDCKTCHEAAFSNAFLKSNHAGLEKSCASCHKGADEHGKAQMAGETSVPAPTLKGMKPAEINETCLGCHNKGKQATWNGGVHDRRGLSCTTCHSVHSFESQQFQLKTVRDPDTCYTCHPAMRAKSLRTSHHPVREGLMSCGSCHNPHDSMTPKMVSANWVNEKCYECHLEKRGPFLWEHAPVRENCLTCHDPHGSSHDKLLVAKQPYLCQRCHLNTRHPGTLYDGQNSVAGPSVSNRAVEHACRNCHQNVHGSNAPSGPYLGR